MALITLTGSMRSVGAISNPPPICDGNPASEAYTNDMSKVLSDLQLRTPDSVFLTSNLGMGFVGGQARCYGGGVDSKQACSECLSVAQIKLVVHCKGREFGSSFGSDQFGLICYMSFYPSAEAYDTSVGKLVYKLQELVIQDTKTWKATWTVGSVTGHASCDWVGTSNDCSTCLGWAATNLFVDCKGSESGSSNGSGRCDMNFKRA
ncbi:hypothetical protein LINGRAHAP2_LOCUS3338 [Linum grandiflorum]